MVRRGNRVSGCDNRRTTQVLLLGWIGIVATGCVSFPGTRGEKEEPFCIVVMPDTQDYAQFHPRIHISQTQWIRANKDRMNILCVVHEGDLTNHNSDDEWRNAERAMRILDGAVPYCIALGNHDMGPNGLAKTRDTDWFDRLFPVARFENETWFGGCYAGSMQNAYYRFRAAGMNFLVLCLEFGPRDEVLEWANEIVTQHADARTIVVTHNYMYSDDTRSGEADKWNPHNYGCGGNDGEEMWEKFVSRHPNIFLVLSGHILNDGLGRQTSVGAHGNQVHEILANYQMKPNGGNGWLRIMTLDPRNDRIDVRTYSPWLHEWAEDDQNCFALDYEMNPTP